MKNKILVSWEIIEVKKREKGTDGRWQKGEKKE